MSLIKETVLFKSLLSLVPPDLQAKQSDLIALSLADAATTSRVHWAQADPNSALTWVLTPQGSDYWEKIDTEYRRKRRAREI